MKLIFKTAALILCVSFPPLFAFSAAPDSYAQAGTQKLNATIEADKATGMWTLQVDTTNNLTGNAYYFADFKNFGSTGLMTYEMKGASDDNGSIQVQWDQGYKVVRHSYPSGTGIRNITVQYEIKTALTKPIALYEFWVASGGYFNAPHLNINYPKGWKVLGVWPQGTVTDSTISIAYPLDNPYAYPALVALIPTDIGSGNVVKTIGRFTLAGPTQSVAKIEQAISSMTYLDELFESSFGAPLPAKITIYVADLSRADVGNEATALAAKPDIILYNKDLLDGQSLLEVQSVLVHEMAHNAEQDARLFRGATYIARWFKEGLAVFMETQARSYIFKTTSNQAVADLTNQTHMFSAADLKRMNAKEFDYSLAGGLRTPAWDGYTHAGIVISRFYQKVGANGMKKLFARLANADSAQLNDYADSTMITNAMSSVSGLFRDEIVFPYKASQNFEKDVAAITRPEYTGAEIDATVGYIKNTIPNYFAGAVSASMVVPPTQPVPPLVSVSAASTSVVTVSTLGACTITRTLKSGMKDATTAGEVSKLQRFLIRGGYLPSGNDSGNFGPMTQKSLQKWQKANGLVSGGTPATTGYGATGPKTRALFVQQCK
ncbi:MAG: peptidoglycan-binding domain-containing protein [Patescibacteria group bacterium]